MLKNDYLTYASGKCDKMQGHRSKEDSAGTTGPWIILFLFPWTGIMLARHDNMQWQWVCSYVQATITDLSKYLPRTKNTQMGFALFVVFKKERKGKQMA